jgi:hypothetical protein
LVVEREREREGDVCVREGREERELRECDVGCVWASQTVKKRDLY